ncbi:MAG TPA: hypothetical protein DCQ90_04280 [Erysipelotrichaceae bacterium]|nr:hypothetical protein [Erysipelotrichaceae bacterium]
MCFSSMINFHVKRERKLPKQVRNNKYSSRDDELKIDCGKCSGLCCVALYCAKSDGFPSDKPAGKPCEYLLNDFRCAIHHELKERKMKGCLAYDCFGAGQKATRSFPQGVNWMTKPSDADEIFAVFRILFQMHQYLWYLLEAVGLADDENTTREIERLIDENERITGLDVRRLVEVDLGGYKSNVDRWLKEVSFKRGSDRRESKNKNVLGKNFKGANLEDGDFTMSLMIAANLKGCKLDGANFLGADLRDANIKNTDLSKCLFLTQMQINSVIGNKQTILPLRLVRPTSWDDR